MRDDGEFLKDLRAEIAAGQIRRQQHIRAKMVFLIALLGIGVASPAPFPSATVLYLTVVVVVIFDLQVLGENFGIRRAGAFIEQSSAAPAEERRWERLVCKNRDVFSSIAEVLSSALALVTAAVALWDRQNRVFWYYAWVLASVGALVFLTIVRHNYATRLETYRAALVSDTSPP